MFNFLSKALNFGTKIDLSLQIIGSLQLKEIGAQIIELSPECKLQIQQDNFTVLQQILEAQKESVAAIYEERKSIYEAIIDNTNYLKNLATMKGDLLNDTQYKELSKNLVDVYNKSVNNVTAYRQNQERFDVDIKETLQRMHEMVKLPGLEDVDISKWFSASGELVEGIANDQIHMLQKRWQELYASGQGGSQEAASG